MASPAPLPEGLQLELETPLPGDRCSLNAAAEAEVAKTNWAEERASLKTQVDSQISGPLDLDFGRASSPEQADAAGQATPATATLQRRVRQRERSRSSVDIGDIPQKAGSPRRIGSRSASATSLVATWSPVGSADSKSDRSPGSARSRQGRSKRARARSFNAAESSKLADKIVTLWRSERETQHFCCGAPGLVSLRPRSSLRTRLSACPVLRLCALTQRTACVSAADDPSTYAVLPSKGLPVHLAGDVLFDLGTICGGVRRTRRVCLWV